MNCDKLSAITGWICVPAGERSIRATAPMTMGDGGQQIAFYIAQPTDSTYFITDACETAIYAEQLGVQLSKSKLDSLNRTCGITLAQFESDWSIEATGTLESLQCALWDAVKLALALSFKTDKWRPKFAQTKFQTLVYNELQAQLGADRIIRNARIQGASGHWIEFPMSVKREHGTELFVQPIALENGKISWPAVYEAQGKLFDVKVASEVENRIAILEDGAAPDEFGRAASFIGHTASVHTFKGIRDWHSVFA